MSSDGKHVLGILVVWSAHSVISIDYSEFIIYFRELYLGGVVTLAQCHKACSERGFGEVSKATTFPSINSICMQIITILTIRLVSYPHRVFSVIAAKLTQATSSAPKSARYRPTTRSLPWFWRKERNPNLYLRKSCLWQQGLTCRYLATVSLFY